jgi:hypothetical protein
VTKVNAQVEIQKMLQDAGHYDGKLDGKIGPKTTTAIDKFLKERGVDATKWSSSRKLVAAEQILYQTQNLEIGAIDGLVGAMTKHAREVYEANLVTTWRDREAVLFPTDEGLEPEAHPKRHRCGRQDLLSQRRRHP